MNIFGIVRSAMLLSMVVFSTAAYGYDYKVQKPSETFRPQWSGAKKGVWTMDYEAAAAKAKANGKFHIMLMTAQWWCPYCQNFENKVGLSDAWKKFVEEKGFYLSMLDFPYRFHVDDEQLNKSKYPEKGDGWGFQCWLYDDEFLAENGLTKEDGFKAIQRFYDKQNELAFETAEVNILRLWDGSDDFGLKKIAYPTLIVFMPDGSEAGRLTAQSIYKMKPEEAQASVINQLNTIMSEALAARCGLCSDPEADECGFTGTKAQQYRGWLSGANGVAGLIDVKTGKINHRGEIKVKASIKIAGNTVDLEAYTDNGCGSVKLTKRGTTYAATLKIGAYGLSGTYTDGGVEYIVTGARDVFSGKATEVESQNRVNALAKGAWSFVMRFEDSDNPLVSDFGVLTIDVKDKGKARVKGRLGDGMNVSYTGQLIAGEDGVFCLPMSVSLYPGKKGGFGCNLWFKNGWLINVTDISSWKCVQKNTTTVLKWTPVYTALPGPGVVAEEMELLFNNPPKDMKGEPLVRNPEAVTITTRKTGWIGTDESLFYARFSAKTAVFSGSMVFYSVRANGRIGRTRATVYGVTLGGTGYGIVTVKNVGNWGVKVSACAACED